MIGLQRKQIIGPGLNDVLGDSTLAAHGIETDQATIEHQALEQKRSLSVAEVLDGHVVSCPADHRVDGDGQDGIKIMALGALDTRIFQVTEVLQQW